MKVAILVGLSSFVLTGAVFGQVGDLAEMSIEDLMNIEVTSVSKTSGTRWESAAAVHVISAEDIRRSGATSVPEVLRLAPGVHVARINSNAWAVSVRGFNGLYANKLLVLVDGRSVYAPMFSGVYWDELDMPLDLIERIEVIRGPGATLWGPNGVNGVINIITKRAADTQGGRLTIGAGDYERGYGTLRYGGRQGDSLFWRVYARHFERDKFNDARGFNASDDWRASRLGVRLDWTLGDEDQLMVQGDYYDETLRQVVRQPVRGHDDLVTEAVELDKAGGHIHGSWEREFADGAKLTVQGYYRGVDRELHATAERRQVVGFELQHEFRPTPRNQLVWGLQYRWTQDEVQEAFSLRFEPKDDTADRVSLMLQDTYDLIPERLKLIIGARLGYDDYADWVFQPTARLLWTPNDNHSFWAAVSRAEQTPGRVYRSSQVRATWLPFGMLSLESGEWTASEELLAFEAGWRGQVHDDLLLDIAAFYHVYDDLRTSELGWPYPECDITAHMPVYLVLPLYTRNKMDGEVYGFEVSAQWQVADWMRLTANYAYLQMQMRVNSGSTDYLSENVQHEAPHNQFSLASHFDLPHNIEADVLAYYVDKLPAPDVDDYVRVDVRLGWRPHEDWELSLVGRNLVGPDRVEYVPIEGLVSSAVSRDFYAEVRWNF